MIDFIVFLSIVCQMRFVRPSITDGRIMALLHITSPLRGAISAFMFCSRPISSRIRGGFGAPGSSDIRPSPKELGTDVLAERGIIWSRSCVGGRFRSTFGQLLKVWNIVFQL